MNDNRLKIILLIATSILAIPLIAMQFSDEVKWTLADFAIMGILLYGTGFTIEYVLRSVTNGYSRLFICGIIIIAVFLVWAELAVGIFGTPIAGS